MSDYLDKWLDLLQSRGEIGDSDAAKDFIDDEMQKLWYYYLSPADKKKIEKLLAQVKHEES